MRIKILAKILCLSFISLLLTTSEAFASEINNCGVVINVQMEEGVDYDVVVELYDAETDMDYSYTVKERDGYSLLGAVTPGTYYPTAHIAGNTSGREWIAYLDPNSIIAEENGTIHLNIVAGSEEYVYKYKNISYNIDEYGNTNAGPTDNINANEQLSKMNPNIATSTDFDPVEINAVSEKELKTKTYIRLALAIGVFAIFILLIAVIKKKKLEREEE